MSYVKSRRMTGGFALIAWPAIFGSSGIMTIQVDQDGVVFQKDLGTSTSRIASRITHFDPDLTWARVEITSSSVDDCFTRVPQGLVQRLQLNLRGWLPKVSLDASRSWLRKPRTTSAADIHQRDDVGERRTP
jgi:Protein of unknown function (DUF2950)